MQIQAQHSLMDITLIVSASPSEVRRAERVAVRRPAVRPPAVSMLLPGDAR